MSAGMAGVIAAHGVAGVSGGTHTACRCNKTWVPHVEYRAHLAEELAKAGYGNVQDAGRRLRDANRKLRQLKTVVRQASLYGSVECDELDAIIDGMWPTAPDPLAAALADPEGHALVKAIQDRKAEG